MLDSFIGNIELGGEPFTYQQALSNPKWLPAMVSELSSLKKNHTWDLVPLPPHVHTISTEWIFKRKPRYDGKQDILKARVITKGFEQRHGLDFQEIFVATVQWESIHLATTLVAHHGWPIYHMEHRIT